VSTRHHMYLYVLELHVVMANGDFGLFVLC